MTQPETPREAGPNPERRSTAALICLIAGMGLVWLSWFLGIGAALSAALQASAPGAAAALLLGAGIAAIGAGLLGFVLALVGGIWLVVQVIVDQTGKDPYSSRVER